jgi:hypothetical protein
MSPSDLAKGTSVMLGVIVAGYVSIGYVDRHIPAQPLATDADQPTGNPDSSACVGADGSWKNWPWPNVPALSPKCK